MSADRLELRAYNRMSTGSTYARPGACGHGLKEANRHPTRPYLILIASRNTELLYGIFCLNPGSRAGTV